MEIDRKYNLIEGEGERANGSMVTKEYLGGGGSNLTHFLLAIPKIVVFRVNRGKMVNFLLNRFEPLFEKRYNE